MSEFRAALQALVERLTRMIGQAYLDRYQEYRYAKALLARPESARITFNEKGEAFIPGISEEDEAIVNAALKRRAADDRIKRPESEPRITREEAMRLLDNLQTAYARMMYQKAHLGEQYDDAREACLAAMGVSESPPAASDGEKP